MKIKKENPSFDEIAVADRIKNLDLLTRRNFQTSVMFEVEVFLKKLVKSYLMELMMDTKN